MAGKYFNKTKLIDFCKRFTASEFQQLLGLSKQNGETNLSIQKRSSFWQQFGWSYYYRQLQAKVERLVNDIDRGFQAIGRKMPSTGNRSMRQAKQNVLQLMTDSKQRMHRLEKDIIHMRDNIDSMSMMEEGKLERHIEARNSFTNISMKCHSEAERNHESGNVENMSSYMKATKATCSNVYSSTTQRLDEHEIFPSDSSVVNTRMSLSTTAGEFPRTAVSTVVKTN